MVKSHVRTLGFQASSLLYFIVFGATFVSHIVARTCSLKTKVTMGQCLSLLLLGVTRQPFQLQWVIKNTTQSMFQSGTSQILHSKHMEMEFFWLPSYPYQRVSLVFLLST